MPPPVVEVAWRDHQRAAGRAAPSGSRRMKACSSVRLPVSGRSSAALLLPTTRSAVHRHQPVETLGLFHHVGGGDQHAIPGPAARIESISSQNWRRDSGSTPVVGSSRISRSGIVHQRAAQPEFPGSCRPTVCAGRSREWRQAGGRQQLVDAASIASLAEQAAGTNRHSPPPTASGEILLPSPCACRRCAVAPGCGSAGWPCRHRILRPGRTGSCVLRPAVPVTTTLPTPSADQPDHAAGRQLDVDILQRHCTISAG